MTVRRLLPKLMLIGLESFFPEKTYDSEDEPPQWGLGGKAHWRDAVDDRTMQRSQRSNDWGYSSLAWSSESEWRTTEWHADDSWEYSDWAWSSVQQ